MKDIKAISKYNTTVTDEEIENGLMDDSGGIYSPDGKRLLQMSLFGINSKSSYTVKDGTEVICDDAFMGCISLKSIVLPNSVTTIGDNAFEGCKSLQSITLSNSLTSIGNVAFAGCKSLQNIVLPDSVISLED